MCSKQQQHLISTYLAVCGHPHMASSSLQLLAPPIVLALTCHTNCLPHTLSHAYPAYLTPPVLLFLLLLFLLLLPIAALSVSATDSSLEPSDFVHIEVLTSDKPTETAMETAKNLANQAAGGFVVVQFIEAHLGRGGVGAR
jgi:hypothetical protein